jgi:hypothetical protein
LLWRTSRAKGRHQGTRFPTILDDLVAVDHVCRVIDAFVDRLKMDVLGFEQAQTAETGRPGDVAGLRDA